MGGYRGERVTGMKGLKACSAAMAGSDLDRPGGARVRCMGRRATQGAVLAVLSGLTPVSAAAAAETSVRSRVDLTGVLAHTSLSPAPSPPVQFTNLSGGGSVQARLYLRPVRDDESSPSLQPFLQRATSFYISISGDGFGSSYAASGQTLASRTYAGTEARLGASVYVGPMAYVGARLGVAYTYLRDSGGSPPSRVQETRSWFLPAMLEAGVRVDDTLISLSYSLPLRFDARGRADLPSWGITALNLRTVLERCIDLTWAAWLLTEGAGVSGDVGYYASAKLGFIAGAYYRYGRLYFDDSERRHDTGGGLGVSYWFSNRLGASLYGSAHWISSRPSGGSQTIEITGSATFSFRL